jgi:DNA-directed RNA polymerase specialized sigma54-like protein
MKFKDVVNEDSNREIWREFYKTSGNLGRQIQGMPINSTTENILNKLNKFIKKNGYLSEPAAYNLLNSKEKKYLENEV